MIHGFGIPFQALVELLPQGVAVHVEGTLAYANAALTRLLGYDGTSEIIGRAWRDFIHPEELARAEANVESALHSRSEGQLGPLERRLIGKDGLVVIVELVAIPLSLDGHRGLMVVVRDLSERKRIERKARRRRSRRCGRTARRRYRARDQQPPRLHHGQPELFAEHAPGTKRHPSDPGSFPDGRALLDAVEEAQQGTEKIRQVVSDLKTFTRGDEGQIGLVNLASLMDATLKMVGKDIRHRARLSREYASPPLVKASEGRIAQLFLNLLVNASQAVAEGRAADNEIGVSLRSDGRGDALVEIRDTGVGIPGPLLSHVTEPFVTTRASGAGLGLGLSVCRNIVEGYGGSLAIESVVGVGTTVRVVLPRAPDGYAPRVTAAPAPTSRRYRILIIDDDPLVLRSFRRLLRMHDVAVAGSGREALEILSGREFDVIFCDLMMPEMTGMDVYERLVALGGGIERKLVFLSGGAFTERALRLLENAPNLRFEKPLDPDQLESILAAATSS